MEVADQIQVPAALAPGKRHSTECTGGWEGPRADLNEGEKSRPYEDSFSELYTSLRSV